MSTPFLDRCLSKTFSPGEFDAQKYNKIDKYLAKVVNFDMFWDYSCDIGFALIKLKSFIKARLVARFMHNTEVVVVEFDWFDQKLYLLQLTKPMVCTLKILCPFQLQAYLAYQLVKCQAVPSRI